jgi:hypothetical protein
MRTYSALALAATVLTGAALNLHAQTWQTVYNSISSGLSGPCGDIGADASGNVFAVGRYEAGGNSVAIVQGSGDQGATWQPLDQYAVSGLNYAHNRAFAANPVSGGLLAGGNLNNLLPDGTYQYDTLWFIREWNPLTRMWSTADDYSALANDVGQASCADILVTPNGDVYATGGSAPGWGLGWVVRRRLASDSGFSTVDADYSGQSTGAGNDLAYHSALGVIAAGVLNNVWTVRHSLSGALGSWTTLDSFQTKVGRSWEWINGTPNGVAVTQSGAIYVAGSAYYAADAKYHWVIRRSTDQGATWSIFDNFLPTGASSAEAFGIAVDKSDNVYVCGRLLDGSGYHWTVRQTQWVPHTTTTKVKGKTITTTTHNWGFATIDSFQIQAGKNSRANAITVDAHGNVFVGGSGLDQSDVQRFVVRKLAAGQ